MTAIVSFITISNNSKKLYLLSDSRVSWPTKPDKLTFDNSTKLFPFINSPEVLAYCGDSLFSLSVLSRIKIQLEFYNNYLTSYDINKKKDIVLKYLNTSMNEYPKHLIIEDIHITHFMVINGNFFGFKYSFTLGGKYEFISTQINIPEKTNIVEANGTGGVLYQSHYEKYEKKYGKYAYVMFFAFMSLIKSKIDPRTGGPPQCVQLDSKGEVKPIGIFINGKINLLGEANNFWDKEFSIELRSEFFEMVNSEGIKLSNDSDRKYMEYIIAEQNKN